MGKKRTTNQELEKKLEIKSVESVYTTYISHSKCAIGMQVDRENRKEKSTTSTSTKSGRRDQALYCWHSIAFYLPFIGCFRMCVRIYTRHLHVIVKIANFFLSLNGCKFVQSQVNGFMLGTLYSSLTFILALVLRLYCSIVKNCKRIVFLLFRLPSVLLLLLLLCCGHKPCFSIVYQSFEWTMNETTKW